MVKISYAFKLPDRLDGKKYSLRLGAETPDIRGREFGRRPFYLPCTWSSTEIHSTVPRVRRQLYLGDGPLWKGVAG